MKNRLQWLRPTLPLARSKALPRGAVDLGPIDVQERADITLILRRSPQAVPGDFDSLCGVSERPTEAEFERKHGAHPDELKAVCAFLKAHGVRVTETHRGAKQVKARGTLKALSSAFGVGLRRYSHGGQSFRHHARQIQIPLDVHPYVVDVVGLDTKPFYAHRRLVTSNPDAQTYDPPNTTSLLVEKVCSLYNFPTNSASGQTVAIVEYSNSVYNPADITAYFSSNQTTRPLPTITTVMAPNSPPDPNLDPTEANLDVSVCGASASGVAIAMYNVPGYNGSTTGDQDVLDTYTRIIFPQAGDPVCHVVSVSWGGGDSQQAYLTTIFQDAAAKGVTLCFSSGDSGSAGGEQFDGMSHVSNSDPWMLLVGGTVVGNVSGSTFTEWFWNQTSAAGGGGVSTYFPIPSYQLNQGITPVDITTNLPGRGSPDISGNAAADSGYLIYSNGTQTEVGGTSATAPMMAGLMAIINAANSKFAGYINPTIYANQTVFRDINPSNTTGGPQTDSVNQSPGYTLAVGWDPLTGIGVPNGVSLKNLLAGTEVSRGPTNTVMSFSGGPVIDNAQITNVYWGSAWTSQTPAASAVSNAITAHYTSSYWDGMEEYFIFHNPKLVQSVTYTGSSPPSFSSLTTAQANTDFQNLLASLFGSSTLTVPTTDNVVFMIYLPLSAGSVSGVTNGHGSFLYQGCPIYYGYVYGLAASGNTTSLNFYSAGAVSATVGTITNPLNTGWSGPGPSSTSSAIVQTEIEGFTQPGETINGTFTYGFYSNAAQDLIVPIAVSPPLVITIVAPNPHTGNSFLLTGTLSGYVIAPTLSYADDGGNPVTIPTTGVTNTGFSFSHPGLTVGSHTTAITDANNGVSASISYSVVTVVSATINPLDKSSSITLSNNSYTATSSGAVPQGGRATFPVLQGKAYFEVTLNAPTNNIAVGLSLVDFNLAETYGIGYDLLSPYTQIGVKSVGYVPTSTFKPGQIVAGNQSFNSSYVQSVGISSNGAGATVGVALDMTGIAPVVWFTSTAMQTDGNTWNNALLASSNPATGLNGYPMPLIQPGPWFATFTTKDTGSQVTFNFGASSFKFAIPTGFSSYDSLTIPYTAPSTAVGPPLFLNTPTPATNLSVPLSWQPPAVGTAPFTYNLQVCLSSLSGATVGPWQNLLTSSSATTYAYTVNPTLTPQGYPIWFRIQASNSQGTGPWTEPLLALVGLAAGFEGVNFNYPATMTSSQVNYAKIATAPDPNAAILDSPTIYSVAYIANTPANAFAFQEIIFDNYPFQTEGQPGEISSYNYIWNFVNGGGTNFETSSLNVNLTDSSFYAGPLTQNVEYQLYSYYIYELLATKSFTIQYMSLTGGSGYTGGFVSRLIPPGAIPINWGTTTQLVMTPVSATTHFAIYYDPNIYTSSTIASSVITGLEAIYTQYVTWFATQANFWPSIKTSLNPVGALVNVFLTAALSFNSRPGGDTSFDVGNLSCQNADIVCTAATISDIQVISYIQFLVAKQLAAVFMTNLSGTSNCTTFVYGAGLAVAMAAELFASPAVNNGTSEPVVADYLNAIVSGSPPGSSRPDYINTNSLTTTFSGGEPIKAYAGIGCNALFNSYLVHQLGFTYTQICAAINTLPVGSTARQIFNVLNKTTGTDPFPPFLAILNANFPGFAPNATLGETIDLIPAVFNTFPINPWPLTLTPPARTITISVPSGITSTTSFAISGNLTGYIFPPVLIVTGLEILGTTGEQGATFGTTPAITTTSYNFPNYTLVAGNYTVTISDSRGTTASTSFTVVVGTPPPSNGIYVLAGVVATSVANAPVQVKVVEATSDGAGTFFPSSTVTTMKAGGGICLGYLDCGFCESFRPYYATAKAAGILINPNTPVFGSGNSAEYSVEFWSPTWLTICENWISSLISAGWNGVYLDVIDGWNYTSSNSDPVVVAAGSAQNSANYMTQFISNLRTYAHGINSNFQIWVNGAEELFNPSLAGEGYTWTPTISYASVIDGMLKEQVLYPNGSKASNTANRNFEKAMLDNCKNAGKPVILVEYITGTTDITDVKTTCASWGYGYYIANPNQNLSGVDTEGWTGIEG